MIRYHAGWVLRCSECGQYAFGCGALPEHKTPWVCGLCVSDLDCTLGVIDLDVPPR